ncbi:MAG: hypothetical protein K8S22_09220 [Betaproteobacteria bacterium]|nr:hypothetical protein [Betaproteobacteria bacterium]
MKKIILASLLMVSVSTAFAQAASTACSSGTASTVPGATDAPVVVPMRLAVLWPKHKLTWA